MSEKWNLRKPQSTSAKEENHALKSALKKETPSGKVYLKIFFNLII